MPNNGCIPIPANQHARPVIALMFYLYLARMINALRAGFNRRPASGNLLAELYVAHSHGVRIHGPTSSPSVPGRREHQRCWAVLLVRLMIKTTMICISVRPNPIASWSILSAITSSIELLFRKSDVRKKGKTRGWELMLSHSFQTGITTGFAKGTESSDMLESIRHLKICAEQTMHPMLLPMIILSQRPFSQD